MLDIEKVYECIENVVKLINEEEEVCVQRMRYTTQSIGNVECTENMVQVLGIEEDVSVQRMWSSC